MKVDAAPPATVLPEVLSEALLRRFDAPGPRYTSYPTADRFVEAFGPADALQALSLRRLGAVAGGLASSQPLSVYVHVPFCESVCYYCACNKVITRHHERARPYLDAVAQELQLVLAATGAGRAVSQLHLGGGSPTFLSDDELAQLMQLLGSAFQLTPSAEVSIEVDPRTVTPERLARLRGMGFGRISFGVQDFNTAVQQAVHRVQPFEQVRELMQHARRLGFASINVDLIYGLPRQTPESFARTVAQVGSLRPDRIALYAYAHLPQRFKPQRRIAVEELPSAAQRIQMLGGAIAGFVAHGYQYIGMDHFALPGDSLAVTKAQGRLHRNFQGYSVQPDGDLIGLGVSAISRVGACYYQNHKSLESYYDALRQGQLPVERGIALSRDDLLRRDVIMALMCQGRVDFEAIEQAHLVRIQDCFATELGQLAELAEAGLVQLEPAAVQVTAAGWFLVRAVAAVFDRNLRSDRQRERFSRVI
ncbi:oxygen-independent coproporphyrinogen III oxidase [Paucibacter sp. R3-3]|uniref:Coproporphyrinogen-III oxidase n=1 Tax=Roseateles agri TaxID=3098619 RepID=A0ABU5DM20_9BURK|nr:oxygen-independent coproporphyrinogen III oxidase [Paucibacter sp. R3-3]MDY0747355.1 oxygen-independent coproporphyrinogen III oxidase [Paucibacter sp. R3-3]